MNPCQACIDQKGKSFRELGHRDLELTESRDWPGGAMNGSHTDRSYRCRVCGTGLHWTDDKMVQRVWS